MTPEEEPSTGEGHARWSLSSLMRNMLSGEVFRVLGGKKAEKTLGNVVDPNSSPSQLIQHDEATKVIQGLIPEALKDVLNPTTVREMLSQLGDADLQDPDAAQVQAKKLAENEVIQRTLSTTRRGKTIRNEGPRVGSNDPCPCCSGKKFKKCHKNDPEGLAKLLAEREKTEEC